VDVKSNIPAVEAVVGAGPNEKGAPASAPPPIEKGAAADGAAAGTAEKASVPTARFAEGGAIASAVSVVEEVEFAEKLNKLFEGVAAGTPNKPVDDVSNILLLPEAEKAENGEEDVTEFFSLEALCPIEKEGV